jgi:hypothetical protein
MPHKAAVRGGLPATLRDPEARTQEDTQGPTPDSSATGSIPITEPKIEESRHDRGLPGVTDRIPSGWPV